MLVLKVRKNITFSYAILVHSIVRGFLQKEGNDVRFEDIGDRFQSIVLLY